MDLRTRLEHRERIFACKMAHALRGREETRDEGEYNMKIYMMRIIYLLRSQSVVVHADCTTYKRKFSKT